MIRIRRPEGQVLHCDISSKKEPPCRQKPDRALLGQAGTPLGATQNQKSAFSVSSSGISFSACDFFTPEGGKAF
jgi:hypothetical protein